MALRHPSDFLLTKRLLRKGTFDPGSPELTDQQLLWCLSQFCAIPRAPTVATSAAIPSVALVPPPLRSFSDDFVQDALCAFHREVAHAAGAGKGERMAACD